MSALPITLLYGALLALLYLLLSARVIQRRREAGINLGSGGDAEMERRIRAHANFAEYVPLLLILIALLEAGGAAAWLLHGLGAALLLARVLHGYALAFTRHWMAGRFLGTLLTFLVLIVAVGSALVQLLQTA